MHLKSVFEQNIGSSVLCQVKVCAMIRCQAVDLCSFLSVIQRLWDRVLAEAISNFSFQYSMSGTPV